MTHLIHLINNMFYWMYLTNIEIQILDYWEYIYIKNNAYQCNPRNTVN